MKQSIIDIAVSLIKDHGPMSSKNIAKEALEKSLIESNAKDPIQSLANTIDKMIREKTTNRLKYVDNSKLVDISDINLKNTDENTHTSQYKEIKVYLTLEQYKIIEVMKSIGFSATEREILQEIISSGLKALKPDIEEKIKNTLTQL